MKEFNLENCGKTCEKNIFEYWAWISMFKWQGPSDSEVNLGQT